MSGEPRILIVEDEESYVDALTVGLAREGFQVDVARDGAEALESFEAGAPDLILLDVMLPTISGIDVCRRIRAGSSVPIIMVTAKTEEIDTVVGLEVGADDYVTKPYRLRELVARIRAVLRRMSEPDDRTGTAGKSDTDVDTLAIAGVRLDVDRHEVFVGDVEVRLPLKEFEVLLLLMENAGKVVTRDVLIDRVWGHDYVGDTKTLDVHVKRLRSKIEDNPKSPERIVTIRGLGYKYEDPDHKR